MGYHPAPARRTSPTPRRRSMSPWLRAFAVPGLALALAASGLPAPQAAFAQDAAPESLTVARCVALARDAAPEVRALAAERAAAHFDSAAAALNRRPHLSI